MHVLLTEIVRGGASRISAMGGVKGCELLRFLMTLQKDSPSEASKMAALLQHVAENGILRNEQKCRVLPGTGLFEFKTSGGVRILAFWDEERLIVCTHGFLKKSQKTPKAELQRGKRLKDEYFAAKAEGRIAFA